MRTVTYYDLTTGRIVGLAYGSIADTDANVPAGCEILEGSFEPGQYYIENGLPVPMAPSPGSYWIFDYVIKQWVNTKTAENEAAEVDSNRKRLLQFSDWTDTVSAKTRLGDALYDAWQTYRQALRDIPEQPGFPYSVVWPVSPEAMA